MRSGLIARLRERGVLRVAASYAVIAWLALQIADVALDPWDLPAWVHRAPLVIALLGFPIAIALAWFLELGDGAVTRDAAADGVARPVVHGWRRHVDIAVISVLGAIVGVFVMRDAGLLGESARPRLGVESSSLAVLPFANTGPYGDQHVSDGLSDELRNQFSRMRSLRVTARSSSVTFQDQSLDAIAIAGKLAVAALLEGTVGRGSGRLQVSVQLIDGRDGKVMWAERYDRPDKDLLTVQSEIANAVVAAVLPRFAASGQAAPAPPTEDPVAYDLYLLGRQKVREAENLELSADYPGASTSKAQAADLFRSAIKSDPKFAQAHASLAGVLLWQAIGRIDEASNAEQAAAIDREVMPDIERALTLDPKNAEAYLVKGRLLRYTHRPGVEAAYRRAVELDPSHARATVDLGWEAIADGRVDERHHMAMRALDLDPMDLKLYTPAIMSAWILGRGDELRAVVDRMLRLFPDHAGAATIACDAWSYLGRPDEMLACVTQMRARFAPDTDLALQLDYRAGAAWEAMGDETGALGYYERVAEQDPGAALDVMRLRRDVPALRRLADESLTRRVSFFDWPIGDALAHAGLTDEAIELHRHAGLGEIMASDESAKPMVSHGVIQLAALLKWRGDDEEAERLLAELSQLFETLRRHGGRSAGIRLGSAKVYALGGRIDEAFEQLALAVDALDAPQGWPFSAKGLETDPALAPLRRDPRFAVQMKRLREREAEARARLPETFRRHGLAWPPESAVP